MYSDIADIDSPVEKIGRSMRRGYSPLRELIKRLANQKEKTLEVKTKRKINLSVSPRVLLVMGLSIVLVGYFYFSNKAYFWLGLFSIIGIVLKFFRTRFFPIEVEPVFFFSVLLTRAYGIKYGMILEILAVLSINIINIDLSPSWIIGLIKPGVVLGLVALFPEMSLVTIGIIAATVRSILGFVLGLIAGVPVNAMIFIPLNPFINAAYFMNFGPLLESLLKMA